MQICQFNRSTQLKLYRYINTNYILFISIINLLSFINKSEIKSSIKMELFINLFFIPHKFLKEKPLCRPLPGCGDRL